MDTTLETRDVLLALSFYMEKGEHTEERQEALQKLFDGIANDEIVLTKKERSDMYISEDTRQRLVDYLYNDLNTDTTNPEVNDLLDILEGKEDE